MTSPERVQVDHEGNESSLTSDVTGSTEVLLEKIKNGSLDKGALLLPCVRSTLHLEMIVGSTMIVVQSAG